MCVYNKVKIPSYRSPHKSGEVVCLNLPGIPAFWMQWIYLYGEDFHSAKTSPAVWSGTAQRAGWQNDSCRMKYSDLLYVTWSWEKVAHFWPILSMDLKIQVECSVHCASYQPRAELKFLTESRISPLKIPLLSPRPVSPPILFAHHASNVRPIGWSFCMECKHSFKAWPWSL